jgi:mono/diheme cytochrome c family protein
MAFGRGITRSIQSDFIRSKGENMFTHRRGFAFLAIFISFLMVVALAACQSKPTEAEEGVARPSNAGGAGDAINLTGDATAGAVVFTANCTRCHGEQGKGGIPNPGSTDGTVPPLNPIDESLKNPDSKVYATNIDLFIEHGSTPEGTGPTFSMLPFGDNKTLTSQQIADVIAYIISLNPVK